MKRSKTTPIPDYPIDRVPPHAIDLEEVVLGACMLESNIINRVQQILSPESFYKPAHQAIYRAIVEIKDKYEPVDILTVTEKLREYNQLSECGGPAYIAQLTNRIASTENTEYHARIVLQKHIQREIITRLHEIENSAYIDEIDTFDLVDEIGKSYDHLSTMAQSGAEMHHVQAVLLEVVEELNKRVAYSTQGRTSGIPTPLKDMNRLLGGWRNTELIIVAARPSMGKTAFMLQIAKHAAMKGHHVAIFSMEMGRISLLNRLMLCETGIDDYRYREGYIDASEWLKIDDAVTRLSKLPLYIDDRAGLSMRQIYAKAAQMKRQKKCDIVLIDYLQLATMKSDNRQYNREQEVSESSRQAKAMAKNLDVPVILLSQLSREVEKRGGEKLPMLSDLRESGSIEQDADVVIFPHRPGYYMKDDPQYENVINFIIAKNRNGATGTVEAMHNETMTAIYDKQVPTAVPMQTYERTETNPF